MVWILNMTFTASTVDRVTVRCAVALLPIIEFPVATIAWLAHISARVREWTCLAAGILDTSTLEIKNVLACRARPSGGLTLLFRTAPAA